MYGQNLCGVQGGTTVTPSTVRLGTGGERPGRGTLWRWFADAVWMVSMQSYVVVVPTAPDSTTKDSDWVKWICSGGACPDQNMRLRKWTTSYLGMLFACADRLVSANIRRAHENRRIQLGRRLQELEDERAIEENMRAAEWTWESWFFL